jgi:2'-5' RNA ligase
MNNINKSRRLFFALWPSDETRQSIVETFSRLSQPAKGRVTQLSNLHVTLHFVGQVTEEVKDCMHAAAQTIDVPGFEFKLDCLGYFPRSKVLWMGSQENSSELSELHNKLGLAIAACGYQLEARAYAPHLTLMRKSSRPGTNSADFSIPWQVNEFVLVESVSVEHGVRYQVIEKYPLS